MEKLVVGMAVGCVLGALIVTNNRKVQALVKKGQDELLDKIDEIVDEKLDMLDEKLDEAKTKKRSTKKAEA